MTKQHLSLLLSVTFCVTWQLPRVELCLGMVQLRIRTEKRIRQLCLELIFCYLRSKRAHLLIFKESGFHLFQIIKYLQWLFLNCIPQKLKQFEFH